MQFTETAVDGAWIIELKRISDDRGFFARTWCGEVMAKHGLSSRITQINTAESTRAGTLRGMHFQSAPHAEVKIASCPRGAVFDVVVDLRRESPTYRRWHGVELTESNFKSLYIPEGCAHGYLTLADNSVLSYTTSHAYAAQSAGGVRHDDPAFGIEWPRPVTVISPADRNWPAYTHRSPTL
jgi:dTDP-4-dehydrorhamnose 3,5-epimerase